MERELRKKLDAVERGAPVEQSRKLRYEDIRESLLTEYKNNHIGLVNVATGKFTAWIIWTSSLATCS